MTQPADPSTSSGAGADTNSPSVPSGPSAYAAATQFWTLVEETIQGIVFDGAPRHPRKLAMNIPIAGAKPPVIGWLSSVGVTFNCRVVGYQLFSLVSGQITVDLQYSTPATHPLATITPPAITLAFPSLIGDQTVNPDVANLLPSLNGFYTENLDTSTWALRELEIGGMVHAYATATDGIIQQCTMLLYLQDLDEKA